MPRASHVCETSLQMKDMSIILVGVQIVVFCVVTHSVVGGYENSGGTCCPHFPGQNK